MNSSESTDARAETEDCLTFNEIYNTYYRKAFLFAKSYVQNDFAAEDIVADSMITLWKHWDNKRQKTIHAFLLNILKNTALDYLKHRRTELSVVETLHVWEQQELDIQIEALEACNPHDIFSQEMTAIIHSTLHSLSEKTRRIFYMSRFEELSNKQIACRLKLSEKSIEYHITKALKTLQKALKDYLPLYALLFCFN